VLRVADGREQRPVHRYHPVGAHAHTS
jgi:hypothetical protein